MDPGPWVLCDCPCHPGQVVSSILRNLSWRADINSKKVLREVGSMTALMECVLRASKVSMGGRGLEKSEEVTTATVMRHRLRIGRPWEKLGNPKVLKPPALNHTAEDWSCGIHTLDKKPHC